MELKDFIAQSVTQIVEGLEVARENIRKYGATVNPDFRRTDSGSSSVQSLEFDIAVSVSPQGEGSKSIGIQIASLGFNRSSESGGGTTTNSRIRFAIPLMLPLGHTATKLVDMHRDKRE